MKLFSSIGSLFHNHIKKIFLGIILITLCVAGFYGWKHYQYRQSVEFAFASIKTALNPPNVNELAKLVDFNSITEDLAQSLAKTFPFYKEGDDQIREIKHVLQAALLKRFLTKEEGEKEETPVEEVKNFEKYLNQPFNILPADFLTQLASTLTIKHIDKNIYLITSHIKHPNLKREFPIMLHLEKIQDTWMVKGLANADNIVKELEGAIMDRLKTVHSLIIKKNENSKKRMDSTLVIQSCEANAGMLSDNKTYVLVVHVLARNQSDLTVKNINIDTSITNSSGEILLHRYLNLATSINPGDDLNHRWTIELDGQSEESQKLMNADKLQCATSWRTMTLSNSSVLHISDLPNSLEPCQKENHQHQKGFCISPIFKD